ncbi:putative protease Do-like 14 [Syzygium oleosum]|uniref:putative protease Do-like 14 n=1 Tax=Syzygium oleosum TaxID=219896 RepID=UPI0011D23941|nr:putative protease Do-like 14 [Syzygium oleosum]
MAELMGPESNLLRVHMQHTLSFPAVLSSDNQNCGKLHLPTLSANPCYSVNDPQESSKIIHKGLGRDTIADVVQEAGSAVVTIYVSYLGSGGIRTDGIGSGIIIHEDGLILTCAHVISQGGQINVILRDGQQFKSRLVVAYLDLDIALLKISPPPKIGLSMAKFGSSSELRPGHWVIAVGCPLSLTHTVTLGIISSECRKSSKLRDEGVERDFLQMDCSITQGNSGGPLFNIDGKLVGINTFCSNTAPGMSFAIPIDNIRALLDPISKWNAVQPEHGWIIYDFYGMMINQKDPSSPDKQGVRVFKVRGGSSAEHAHIKQGDLIVNFDGKPIDGDIRKIMDVLKKKYRQRIKVVIQRENGAPRIYTMLPEEKNQHAPRITGLVRSKI